MIKQYLLLTRHNVILLHAAPCIISRSESISKTAVVSRKFSKKFYD